MDTKKCKDCKRIISTEEFAITLNENGVYFASYCRTCANKRGKWRRWNKKIRIIQHYSNGTMSCACCGEAHLNFLAIDHIDGGGKKHREELGYSGAPFYEWLERNNYPKGFRVLCFNCNFSLASFKWCPHKMHRKNSSEIYQELKEGL